MTNQFDLKNKLGVMQGRLSPILNGKIQSFPWQNWKNEFYDLYDLNINLVEWTIDQENLYENPIMNSKDQIVIKRLMKKCKVKIISLTGDCFMQAPFWKCDGHEQKQLMIDFVNVIKSSSSIGIKFVIVPLVDNGSIKSDKQENILFEFLKENIDLFKETKTQVLFESDYDPIKLKKFINRFDTKYFGINYDTGNSSSFGFNPEEEIYSYGDYIQNVHIKDRHFNGETVPLGKGDTDFKKIFNLLKSINYRGNFILQAARDNNNHHVKILKEYINFLENI